MNNWGLFAALVIIAATTSVIWTINRGENAPYEFAPPFDMTSSDDHTPQIDKQHTN